jgi:hypothetical protein
VHHAAKGDILRLDLDADLFGGLTPGRRDHGLVAIQVTGGHAVLAVSIARVEAAQQQDLPGAEEEQVYGGGEAGAHGGIIV